MNNIKITFLHLSDAPRFIKKHKIVQNEMIDYDGLTLTLPLYMLQYAKESDLVEEVIEVVPAPSLEPLICANQVW